MREFGNRFVTVDRDLLQGLFVRDGGLARLVEDILNQILDAQATEQLKAKPYERTEGRQGYRNGYREKLLKSRIRRTRAAGSPAPERALLDRDLCTVPAERAGAITCYDRDGCKRRIHQESEGCC